MSINSLPKEILTNEIFKHLDAKDLRSIAPVSKKWNTMSKQDSLWNPLFLKKFPNTKISQFDIPTKLKYFICAAPKQWDVKVAAERKTSNLIRAGRTLVSSVTAAVGTVLAQKVVEPLITSSLEATLGSILTTGIAGCASVVVGSAIGTSVSHMLGKRAADKGIPSKSLQSRTQALTALSVGTAIAGGIGYALGNSVGTAVRAVAAAFNPVAYSITKQ